MSRITLKLVFLSAGLMSAAATAADLATGTIPELKLAMPLQPQALNSTAGLPVISTAAFERRFWEGPVSTRPVEIAADSPEASLIEWSDALRSEPSLIDGFESLLAPPPASAGLVPTVSSPLDAEASPNLWEGGVTVGAIRVMPLGVFSSR